MTSHDWTTIYHIYWRGAELVDTNRLSAHEKARYATVANRHGINGLQKFIVLCLIWRLTPKQADWQLTHKPRSTAKLIFVEDVKRLKRQRPRR